MAIRDLEAFLRQRAADFDASMDATPGSPFDAKIIQPLVRRLGIDPFTVDLLTFTTSRLKQLYPNMATDDGDNIVDLLVKPATLLWDPIVRENTRVRRGLSFADPTTLTLDEADSLGGNFFDPRRRGSLARGPGRIYFSSPQDATVTPNNFVTSRTGLVFLPSESQSIRSQEMILNLDPAQNLYYFDVNLVASAPGDAYNIGPNELISIANMPGAVRVYNSRRFRLGEPEESAVDYARRLQSSTGEKSMATLRGIAAKVLSSFPEVQRLNVVGYGDPEMKRDIIQGGGLGAPLAAGVAGEVMSDTEGKARSRRFHTAEVDFQTTVGLSEASLVLTLLNPGGANDPFLTTEVVRDIAVLRVLDAHTLDLEEQVLVMGAVTLPWVLRRRELTLSKIPGGILFPDSPNGTVTIPDDVVHVGGCDDIHIRTTSFDDATATIEGVTDDDPVLSGTKAYFNYWTNITLEDFTIGLNYIDGDATDLALEAAGSEGFSLQIEDGPNAGTYRVVSLTMLGLNPTMVLATPLSVLESTRRRWRLFDDINVDLVEPKETRITDSDLVTTQGSDIVTTLSGIDFSVYGVVKGDTLRILEGSEKGDYTLAADPIAPSYSNLQLDRSFPRTLGATKYTIFHPSGEGIQRPLVRVKSLELLDSSSQPQGSYIPYAKPVDVQSRAFQNPARGVKHDFSDVRVGLVSGETDGGVFTGVLAGHTLVITVLQAIPASVTVTFPSSFPTLADAITLISTALETLTGSPDAALAVTGTRLGIRPIDTGVLAITGGTARTGLFGNDEFRTTADVRVKDPVSSGDIAWSALDPSIDAVTGLDILQIVDGVNAGFYSGPFLLDPDASSAYTLTTPSKALILADSLADLFAGTGTNFLAPESSRRVKIGSRSIGSARVYFLEPTTFEVDADSAVFELDTGDTGLAHFIPDPTLDYQRIPALPGGTTPDDGSSTDGGTTFTTASQSLILSGIKPKDKLVIKTFPLAGTVVVPDPVPNLVGQTLIFSVDGGPDRTLTFIRDDLSLSSTDVSRGGVVNQINAKAGIQIASLNGSNQLQFKTDHDFVVRKDGTALPTILGSILGYTPTKSFTVEDTSNASPHAGTYKVTAVPTDTTLTVTPAFPSLTGFASPVTSQTFQILRSGVQRICTTQMQDNKAEAGLYYFDVELVSEGTGDFWNIEADEQLTVTGYKSDGYYLTTDDENLSFSDLEPVKMVLSRSILEPGVDDDPQNATQLSGQNILVSYDRSSAVSSVQDYASSDFERALDANPLVRHLVPHFIRFDVTYYGGSAESVVVPDLESLISGLYPVDTLDASAIQKVIQARGATKVVNPITMIAVVHFTDRTIYVHRSQDSLSATRLAAFVPDLLAVTRKLG